MAAADSSFHNGPNAVKFADSIGEMLAGTSNEHERWRNAQLVRNVTYLSPKMEEHIEK